MKIFKKIFENIKSRKTFEQKILEAISNNSGKVVKAVMLNENDSKLSLFSYIPDIKLDENVLISVLGLTKVTIERKY